MMEGELYSFEKKRKNLWNRLVRIWHWLLGFVGEEDIKKTDKAIFYYRLGIPLAKKVNKEDKENKLNHKERFIVEGFLRNNIYNIYWYTKKIRKEKRILNVYYLLTLIVLIGVPVFIFMVTYNFADAPESTQAAVNTVADTTTQTATSAVIDTAAQTAANVDTNTTAKTATNTEPVQNLQAQKDQLAKQIDLSSIITIVVTSLLALLKFISSWLDQRKVVVEFSKAAVKLKDTYYHIEGVFYQRATDGTINFDGKIDKQFLSDEFLNALSGGTVISRRIINEETNKFHELRAQPSFDIGQIWSSSASTAKNALNLFKANSFNPDELKVKLQTAEEKKTAIKTDLASKEKAQELLVLKIKQNRKTVEKISLKLDELEDKKDTIGGLTDREEALIVQYENNFDELDEATDTLETQYEKNDLEIKLLKADVENVELGAF
ncbi:MAG: hypothetical protein AB8B74_12160 [Crocinitomicaceae bacterium]